MRRFIRKTIYVLGWFALPAAVVAAVAVFTGLYYYSQYTGKASKFDLSKIGELKQRSAIYDMHGEFYSHLPGMNRQIVTLDKVNGWFIQALLAREDSTFWTHKGVEPKSVLRAALANLRGGGIKQGASTLTQQLARNALDLGGRNYDRKATEAALAMRIEKELTKQQILEHYVNRIYFGAGFYGIEAAARGYFGKPAAELTLGESAMLAGLICSPNRLSPARHLEQAIGARDEVLGRMLDEHMVTPELVSAAKAAKIELAKTPAFPSELDYVTDAVTRALGDVLDADAIERGGLRVHCTIDPQLQKNAEAAADRQLAKIEEGKKWPHPKRAEFVAEKGEDGNEKPTDYIQSAVVVVDNKTGAVRACVGGRDYNESKYQRALISYRQIGSTFKPFVFAAAFERGMSPQTPVSDDKIQPGELQQVSNKWSPENSDGEYLGIQPAAVGLIKSRNTMSVRIGQAVGLAGVRKLANAVSIGERMPDYPVAFLGAFETTLRDLAAAYATFPNGGVYRPPFLISRVENDRGEVIFAAGKKEVKAMSPDAAWMVTSCLHEVMRTGTASKATQLGWKKPGAGKTGTTNDFHDAWYVGYTSSLTCGVWVGMDKPQTIMEKGYGSALALPIWVDVMNGAPEQTYPAQPFQAPVQLVKARLCQATGTAATQGCELARKAYDAELPATRIPQQRCTAHPDPVPVAPPQTFAFGGTPAQPGVNPGASANPPPLEPFYPTPAPQTPAPQPAAAQANDPYTTPGEPYRVVRTPNGIQIYQGRVTPPAQASPTAQVQPPGQPAQAQPPRVQATPAPIAPPRVAAQTTPYQPRPDARPAAEVPHIAEGRVGVTNTRPAPPNAPRPAPRTVINESVPPADVAVPSRRVVQQPRYAEPEPPRPVQTDPRFTTRSRSQIGRDGLTDEERRLLSERRIRRSSAEEEEMEPAPAPVSRSRGTSTVRRAVPANAEPRVRPPQDLDGMVESAPPQPSRRGGLFESDDEEPPRQAQPRRKLFSKPLFGDD